MFEDLVPAIASALSAQGSELIIAGSKSALKSVFDVVRARFGCGTPEAESLDAALRHPNDAERIDEFAKVLARVMAEDPAFARRTVSAWQTTVATSSAEDAGLVNNFSGRAEQVVQARTIRGGIKF